jgi:hypothetical protein
VTDLELLALVGIVDPPARHRRHGHQRGAVRGDERRAGGGRDRRRRQQRARAEKAGIGIAMGTGTEVARQAAVMIVTDDNFATIIKAVELGRGLYDNLARYIRFETGCMFGFIISFLGASLFNIADGEPLIPLQILWVASTRPSPSRPGCPSSSWSCPPSCGPFRRY